MDVLAQSAWTCTADVLAKRSVKRVSEHASQSFPVSKAIIDAEAWPMFRVSYDLSVMGAECPVFSVLFSGQRYSQK